MTRPLYILPIVFLAFLSGAVVVVRAHRATPLVAEAHTPRERAALALLGAVGNDRPSAGMVQAVVDWSRSEDGGDGAMARNNPWNTTKCGFNQIGAINNDGACGVAGYATFEDGIAATAATLDQGNFAGVRAALLGDDPEAFKQALFASPWAESHYGYGAAWAEETQMRVSLPAAYTAPPLQVAGAGCLEPNVTSAYEHSPGLQHVVIPSGADWSFNEHWQIANDQTACPGQSFVGGGVCNMASRYSNVARALGLPVASQYHGYVYDSAVPPEDNLAIMSSGGRGGQDLVITNTTDRTLIITAMLDGNQLIVAGGFQ